MPQQTYLGTSLKSPAEILDHSIDWSEHLVPLGDAIKDFECSVDAGITVWGSNFTDLDTTVFLDGGSAGSKYTVTHTITTEAGRKFQRSIRIRCIQR